MDHQNIMIFKKRVMIILNYHIKKIKIMDILDKRLKNRYKRIKNQNMKRKKLIN